MKKVRSTILAIIALFSAVIVSAVSYNLYTSNAIPMEAKKMSNGKKVNTTRDADTVMEITHIRNKRDFVYPIDDTRDPFLSKSATAVVQRAPEQPVLIAQTTPIRLNGIIWNDKESMAIVMDSANKTHLAKVGDKIEKFKIVGINRTGIKVLNGNEIFDIILWPAKTL